MENLRKMTEQDRESVLEMMRDFYTSDAVLSNGSEQIYNNDITACISDSPFIDGFIFMDEDGSTAGYAMTAHSFCTEFGKPCIWIEDLYLKEKLRGKGMATGFFDYLKKTYPDHVHRLEAEHENEHALEVYYRNGFKELPYTEMIR